MHPTSYSILMLPEVFSYRSHSLQYMRVLVVHGLRHRLSPSARGIVRPLLLRLEPAYRSTLEDHVYRQAAMGTWVLINARWYYSVADM